MTKIINLYDPFDGTTLPAQFEAFNTPTSVTVGSGNVVVRSRSDTTISGIRTTTDYDWTGSEIQWEIPSLIGIDGWFCGCVLASGNGPCMYIGTNNRPSAGQMSPSFGYGNIGTDITASQWRFFKIVIGATDTLFQNSVDGTSWTTFKTSLTSTFGTLTAGRWFFGARNIGQLDFTLTQVGVAPAPPPEPPPPPPSTFSFANTAFSTSAFSVGAFSLEQAIGPTPTVSGDFGRRRIASFVKRGGVGSLRGRIT